MTRLIRFFCVAVVAIVTAFGQASPNSEWSVKTEISPMDSVKTVTAARRSLEIPAATLVIRCTDRRAEVYVDTHETIEQEAGVRIKFDGGKPVKQYWQRASSYDALFSPTAGNFLRDLRTSKTLYFEYSPLGKTPRVVTFGVSDIPGAMESACINAEIEKAKKATDERLKMLAEQKQAKEAEQRRIAALRRKCAPFASETLEDVERAVSALPPFECWDVLEWMRDAGSYEEIVKRRNLCNLPAFAADSKFCGPQGSK